MDRMIYGPASFVFSSSKLNEPPSEEEEEEDKYVFVLEAELSVFEVNTGGLVVVVAVIGEFKECEFELITF